MAKILIVEDDELINNLIKENLTLVGHECVQIYDGKIAEEYLKEWEGDLIILDIMLPYISGFELLPKCSGTPVIFLTAKDSVMDKIKGLNMGAEDYIVKPFEMLELIARVNVVLRRCEKNEKKIQIGTAAVDLESHVVTVEGKEVSLTIKEYELLEYLILNKNIALSRDRLLEQVWGYDYEGDARTIDVHISALRHKLNLEKNLKTVYKLGYRLEL